MIKLTFLGDILLDYEMSKDLSKYISPNNRFDFTDMFSHIQPPLASSDYVLANLETPISFDDTGLTNKRWEFCSPLEFAEAVKAAGVDFVSTANNHCMDRGLSGLGSTVRSLDAVGLQHCGICPPPRENYVVTKVGDLKIGILAYTYGTNAFSNHNYLRPKNFRCVNLLQAQEGWTKRAWTRLFHGHGKRVFRCISRLLFPDNDGKQVYEKRTISLYRRLLIRRDLRRIRREKPDYLIAYLHVGGQYNREPSRYTRETVDWFAKHGCDAVIANHEHVIHGMEICGNKLKSFALGNCTGSSGLIHEPFDRRSEYSIALHAYLDEQTAALRELSFSVLKARITQDGKLEVWPAASLLEYTAEPERARLQYEIIAAAKDFSGIDYSAILAEFPLFPAEEAGGY